MPVTLCERLTFDRLFRISEPKRVYRSFTVKGPPLEIDSYQDAVYYIFNFKANPSTTGLRHRGYVKFFKPKLKNPKNVPLQHMECLVDCTCPDFRYRWAWANKQRQSSLVGPQSLNQAWNKAPRKTNPKGTPGLCKHILATRQYIYGLMSSFPSGEPDTAAKLDRITKYATKRWTDFDGQMRAAKEREREIRRRRELRNIGQLPVAPPAAPEPEEPEEKPVSVDAPQRTPKDQKQKTTVDLKKERPPKLPASTTPTSSPSLAIPPGERGRQFPTAKPKRVIGNRKINPPKPGDKGWIKPQEAALCEPLRDLILESVVKPNGDTMSNINEAIKLVEEMEADELSHLQAGGAPDMGVGDMGGADIGGETLEPSEPPVSDTAIGADTEGDTALGLLRDMKTSLQQIAAAVAPVEELPPDGMGGAPGGAPGGAIPPGGEDEAIPMPDEPPADLEDEGAAEAAEGAAEEDEGAAEEDEDKKKEAAED